MAEVLLKHDDYLLFEQGKPLTIYHCHFSGSDESIFQKGALVEVKKEGLESGALKGVITTNPVWCPSLGYGAEIYKLIILAIL